MEDSVKSKQLFEELPVPAALRTMVTPTIISQIIILIYNMADTFYVGRVNDPYMVAGVSLILPIFNITLCIANLAGVGGGTLVSRLLGTGRQEEARRVSWFSFWLAALSSLLFSAGVGIFMTPLLKLLGASENTFGYARQYVFCVIVLGCLPSVLSNVMASMLRSTGNARRAGFGITMGGVLNIALDPLFMFVVLPGGYEALGVGIATLLSNCAACAYFFVVLFRLRGSTPITLDPRSGLPERGSVRSVFVVGMPAALSTFLFDLAYIIIDRLMAAYSDVALAAIGIVLKVERLPLNVGVGICQGMTPLAAYNYAAKNYPRMDETVRCSRRLGLLVAAVSVILYEILAFPIVRFFIPDPGTVELAARFLRLRVLATPFMFLCFFTVHLFQALGRGGAALLLGVSRWALLNIPMLFLLDRLFGMFGIVWTQVASDAVMAAVSLLFYRRVWHGLARLQSGAGEGGDGNPAQATRPPDG